MAPKRKGEGCARKCPTKTCPTPKPVPKLIMKGNIEVLNLVTGPDSITTIELYLNTRMGQNDESKENYGYSEKVTVANSSDQDKPTSGEIPTYSTARINLPMLNEDLTCNTLTMWEAVSVKTEVVGVSSLVNVHMATKRMYDDKGIGFPVEGMNFHMFAVGGEPLELQFLTGNYRTDYSANDKLVVPPIKHQSTQGLNPHYKQKLTKDGAFPVECWCPDPSKNENTRYYGSYTGGQSTPPVLQFTNTVTTVLLDENGVGPLCKGDGLYVSCCDIVGFLVGKDGDMQYRGLPRYFNILLRKRTVRNPYPVSSLLNNLFTGLMPAVQGQPMDNGLSTQVEEVRVYDGTEGLPGDPDMVRYIDKFGQDKTRPPFPARLY
uniref:Capsid protein VP1 n=1 Tax=Trichodysplasia spinulosa-associated polyomavirus TaxID=862909 RepID=V5XWT6_9POLY|nr:VP1 [Trichodysplasia spinulosa-associated polyomavirus]AOA60181.1 VP1 [Trichodysplasia spinulosa-associated polyomavirus]AOA60186.1 VP1 [Trichodysplasia spinulosa-associated polyomavirus]AOA60191.1 VP1 [Trichodysplasia spinulosa-associated polyomavirus]AOA60196.1 VP1 [Trichodysplasia spinulosa-associated polyomavirus]